MLERLPVMAATPSPLPAAPLDEHDALPAGTRFGELEILRVLGTGGFGIVYLAQDHALERKVALKEYMPGALAGRGAGKMVSVRSSANRETYALGLRSFVNESRLLARFNHPSLVKVYRFWEENGTAYMVMPYLQGVTLREVRRSMTEAPTESWIRSVTDPLLDALELLHNEGVYHRDIAPDNVLLPPGGPPVLLDFGAARRTIGDRTQTFTAILKPSYAPIEQYAEVVQLRQGPWTDLYALGAVVYYLLRGAPPPPSTARVVQDDAPLLTQESNPDISMQFLAAIDWALAVKPSDRPQSIAALRDVLDGRAIPPTHARPDVTAPSRYVRSPEPDPQRFDPTLPVDGKDDAVTAWMAEDGSRMQTVPTEPLPLEASGPENENAIVLLDIDTLPVAVRSRKRVWLAATGAIGALALAGWMMAGRESAPTSGAGTVIEPAAPPVLPAVLDKPTPLPPRTAAAAAAPSPATMAAVASAPVRARARHRLAPAPAHAGPASPREACVDRNFLAHGRCMEEQCQLPRYHAHPQCVAVREMIERRRWRSEG
jgi:serine/threonine protein kinase